MLGQLSEMLASQGNTTLAPALASARAKIINATLSECYVPGKDDGGFWQSIYPNNTAPVEVRTIVDFQAVTKWMIESLDDTHRDEMASVFLRELKGTEGWPIALSRRDKL